MTTLIGSSAVLTARVADVFVGAIASLGTLGPAESVAALGAFLAGTSGIAVLRWLSRPEPVHGGPPAEEPGLRYRKAA